MSRGGAAGSDGVAVLIDVTAGLEAAAGELPGAASLGREAVTPAVVGAAGVAQERFAADVEPLLALLDPASSA